MRKVFRWAFVSLALLIALCVAATWMLYHAARREPKFYKEAMQIEVHRQVEVGDQFEHEVLELRNDARQVGEWQAVFTAQQINAWLAIDLPEKFPEVLPAGVEDPRVAIEDEVIRVAARYTKDSFESVISFALDVRLTEEPNHLAIRIHDVRAGALPVPLTAWLEKLQERSRDTKLNVQWSQSDGDPVAIVEVPSYDPDKPDQMLLLESVAVEQGSLRFAGRTGSAESLGVQLDSSDSAIVQGAASAAESPESDSTQRVSGDER